ncbi:MAG: LacI family DNA-binding transcriptional regulator [Planctomycetes bacterium]|nr:LacI family DNA-binding transcriptional regulator [Planctomycetota bacterium]
MPVTVTDVAKAAGMSQPAVSQILNGSTRYKATSIAKVFAAAERLGYKPNTHARTLRSGRFGAVAYLLPPVSADQAGWLQEQLLIGMEAALAADNRHLVVAHLPDEQRSSSGDVPKMLRQWMVDAFVIDHSYITPPSIIEMMERSPVPCAWLNIDRPTDVVRCDEIAASRQATDILLARGHRRIAFLDYSRDPQTGSWHFSNQMRLQGYQEAMTAAGLPARWIGGDIQSEVIAFTRAWLSKDDRPTAVVSYSAELVHPLAQSLAFSGHNLGRELSFISFGTTNWMGRQRVDLMITPSRAVGEKVINLLDAKIAAGSPQPTRLLPMTYCAGSTIGPPPI